MRCHLLPAAILALLTVAAATAGTLALRQPRPGAGSVVLRTLALPAHPLGATFDQQSGRLYVLGQAMERNDATGAYGLAGGSAVSGAETTLSIIDTRGGSRVRGAVTLGAPEAIALDSPDRLLYVGSDRDNSVRALDARTGMPLRSVRLGVWSNALALDTRTNRLFVVNTIAGSVSILDARQTRLLRTTDLISAVRFYNIVVDTMRGRVFIGGVYWVAVLDARHGNLLQMISLGSPGTQEQSQPAAQLALDEAQGHVFALEPGSVSVLDAGTGSVIRRIRVSAAAALAVDVRRAHLLIAGKAPANSAGRDHGAGQLQVVNLPDGALLRAIPLGLTPTAVFIDQQTDRVLVVDSGGLQAVRDPVAWLPDRVRASLPFLSAPELEEREVPGSVTIVDLKRLQPAPHR